MNINIGISLLLLISLYISNSEGYKASKHICKYSNTKLSARISKIGDEPFKPAAKPIPKYIVGENVPEEISKHNAIYDMILVERFSIPERTDVGIFIPKVEGKDMKHTGKILSMPSTYGLESEQGRIQSISDIMPYRVGDIVLIRDPWGVGPKDFEIGERCFSFHKAEHITGKFA